MAPRIPAVAGRFYPSEPAACRDELTACVPTEFDEALPDHPWGGIVPHAGWICSGAVVGRTVGAIARKRQPDTVVVFGAVHVRCDRRAAAYPYGAWRTPIGDVEIDSSLAASVCETSDLVSPHPGVHRAEHSIEVVVPFIQHLMPVAKILPIMTPPSEDAAAVGAAVGRACRESGRNVAFLGSTDLTHYGPSYGFVPQGIGEAALEWATDVNDRRMIDLMLELRANEAVIEACVHHNACGPGAIAATIAACREMGAKRASLLAHTNSYEVLRARCDQSYADAVGYAAVLFW